MIHLSSWYFLITSTALGDGWGAGEFILKLLFAQMLDKVGIAGLRCWFISQRALMTCDETKIALLKTQFKMDNFLGCKPV